MATSHRRFIIGIDLGTTNSAVSYVDLLGEETDEREIRIFRVPQLTGPGEISQLDFLPSFLYLAGEHEISDSAVDLPWEPGCRTIAGAFARDQGARVPKRLVFSSKSWLCHGKVDRRAPILPWGADEGLQRVSPIEATSTFLRHIREAWNHYHAGEENLYLENQLVIITVPASFDQVARDLTVEAAQQAGIGDITLLEEPLAAFYRWLYLHERHWDQLVQPGELILVCDVGGGTTDFTLITLREVGGKPVFERIAVGDHLLLGGDNMDLTLARHLELRLQNGRQESLNIHRWQALCQQCREAKESMLSGLADSRVVTLVGEGRRLIADTLSATLDLVEVEKIILDGFFPLVEDQENVSEEARHGMTEFGLPYAQDPAITRHLFRFLRRHTDGVKEVLGRETPKPDLVLFNGGALKPLAVQERLRGMLRSCFHESDEAFPRVLVNSDLDLAVSLGAAYYGLVQAGSGIRVGSGSARAYYLAVGESDTVQTVAGGPHLAICLVERGMEEGSRIDLATREFRVLANQPVGFDLYSSSFRTGDRAGDLVEIDDSLTPLPPVQTVIRFGKKARETSLPVRVEARYTELGTLAIWCRALQSEHRWRLQFQLREQRGDAPETDREVFEESLVEQVFALIEETFSSKKEDTAPEALVGAIADMVERPKEEWPSSLIRRMADRLAGAVSARELSPEHESRWLNLTGFCLRPGFGDALDEDRIQRLWKIFNDGPIHTRKAQVISEWWILWRRVAGGLNQGHQKKVLREVSPLLRAGKGGAKKLKKRLSAQAHMEMWMALASMERLTVQDKVFWGRLLLKNLTPKRSRPQYWWALSRIGAREPLYGPVDKVIPPDEVASWTETILSKPWRNPKPVIMALSHLCRLTGDRKRDLESRALGPAREWLRASGAAENHVKMLEDVVPMARHEESIIFGDSLPPGILMHTDGG